MDGRRPCGHPHAPNQGAMVTPSLPLRLSFVTATSPGDLVTNGIKLSVSKGMPDFLGGASPIHDESHDKRRGAGAGEAPCVNQSPPSKFPTPRAHTHTSQHMLTSSSRTHPVPTHDTHRHSDGHPDRGPRGPSKKQNRHGQHQQHAKQSHIPIAPPGGQEQQ